MSKRRRARTTRLRTPSAHGGPSVETLRQQNERRADEIERLRAQNLALKALLGITHYPRQLTLLEHAARAILIAAVSTDPTTSQQIGTSLRRLADPPLPGAGTSPARRHAATLERDIRTAIDKFLTAADHIWHPPKPPPEPKVWCRNTHCGAANKRIPRYVGPGESKIELTHCSVCGGRLTTA